MKTALLAALLFAVTPALAYPQASKTLGNPNFGKADDYGSDRFNAVNHCMVEGITKKQKPDPTGLSLTICMDRQGFEFCQDCQIFGNRGPTCATNDQGHFHSWCWKEVD